MFYEIDQGTQERRYFSRATLYSQIDWSSFNQVVDAYRQRLHDWYIGPAKMLANNIHFALSVMALNCLLIDTLSQFVAGIEASNRKTFKEFIRTRLPDIYSFRLSTVITHYDGKETSTLEDVADVLYHGFRCGILHQAHIPPYGCVIPDSKEGPVIEVSGLVKYKRSQVDCPDCPTIVVDPLKLLEDLDRTFESYLTELKDPRNERLRQHFKRKFSSCFGVNIDAAS